MKTRCKFRVESVTLYQGAEVIKLNAISGGLTEEDKGFSKYTPSGDLQFNVNNPEVVGHFKPGTFYYLDLTPCE